eukprot:TRINITY_DN75699_c0_g1_i1.p1 TRINITY_DN75699_c0_g1~~TRINITY_DN75699_c0_g1_i1.p1  ORF type:complete len:231 (+),score=21.84 TRINITY_DN75699_c0_g1_i1:42-734(+)
MNSYSLEDREANPFHQLLLHWQNEKYAPELLDYQSELVQELQQQMDDQEANENVETQEWSTDLPAKSFFKLDRDQIRFLLVDYHRLRLEKIRKYVHYTLSDQSTVDKLSVAEHKFAKAFAEADFELFKNSILNHLPKQLQDHTVEEAESSTKEEPDSDAVLKPKKTGQVMLDMLRKPNLDVHVWCRVLRELPGFKLGPDTDPQDLKPGNTMLCVYTSLQPLLADGTVQLV